MNFLRTKPAEYEIQMVSMVDVIFTLLIFFVLGSEFRLPEKSFPMGYNSGQTLAGARLDDFPKTVRVALRGQAQGVAIAVGQVDLGIDNYDGIRQKLSEINMPEITVVVAADPKLSVEQVARAVDAVLASPMKNVALASLGKPVVRTKAGAAADPQDQTLAGP